MDSYNDWDIEEGNEVKKTNGECIGYTLLIDEGLLREKVEEAVRTMEGFEWSGWGVPLYLHNDGELTVGGIISNSTWADGDFVELDRIETWNVEISIGHWLQDLSTRLDEDFAKKTYKKYKEKSDFLGYEDLTKKEQKDYDELRDICLEDDVITTVDSEIDALKEKLKEEGIEIAYIL